MEKFKTIRCIAMILVSILTLGMLPLIALLVAVDWEDFKEIYY